MDKVEEDMVSLPIEVTLSTVEESEVSLLVEDEPPTVGRNIILLYCHNALYFNKARKSSSIYSYSSIVQTILYIYIYI